MLSDSILKSQVSSGEANQAGNNNDKKFVEKKGPDKERCSPAMTTEIHMGWGVPE